MSVAWMAALGAASLVYAVTFAVRGVLEQRERGCATLHTSVLWLLSTIVACGWLYRVVDAFARALEGTP